MFYLILMQLDVVSKTVFIWYITNQIGVGTNQYYYPTHLNPQSLHIIIVSHLVKILKYTRISERTNFLLFPRINHQNRIIKIYVSGEERRVSLQKLFLNPRPRALGPFL